MGADAVMRAGTEIQALAFTAEASRAYLAQFHRVGGSLDEQLDRSDRAFRDYPRASVLTAPPAGPEGPLTAWR